LFYRRSLQRLTDTNTSSRSFTFWFKRNEGHRRAAITEHLVAGGASASIRSAQRPGRARRLCTGVSVTVDSPEKQRVGIIG
jgi:hypothetical protein